MDWIHVSRKDVKTRRIINSQGALQKIICYNRRAGKELLEKACFDEAVRVSI